LAKKLLSLWLRCCCCFQIKWRWPRPKNLQIAIFTSAIF